MRLMLDFKCEAGHVTERFEDADVYSVTCKCGKHAKRLISAPRIKLEGLSGDFPSAADAWEKRREDRMKQERKHKRDHGTEWIGKSADDFPWRPDPVE